MLRPLYGLCDAGDLWHTTLDKHYRDELGMEQFKTASALYYQQRHKKLEGISGCYVDDLPRTGNAIFQQKSRMTNKRFEMAEEHQLPCEFNGVF